MNRNLLAHPEHYTQSCDYDSQALRRFRLCPECVEGEGKLLLAIHDGGCCLMYTAFVVVVVDVVVVLVLVLVIVVVDVVVVVVVLRNHSNTPKRGK
jgi:hypothetical protein